MLRQATDVERYGSGPESQEYFLVRAVDLRKMIDLGRNEHWGAGPMWTDNDFGVEPPERHGAMHSEFGTGVPAQQYGTRSNMHNPSNGGASLAQEQCDSSEPSPDSGQSQGKAKTDNSGSVQEHPGPTSRLRITNVSSGSSDPDAHTTQVPLPSKIPQPQGGSQGRPS